MYNTELKALPQVGFGGINGSGTADDGNHFIQVLECNQQAFQNVCPITSKIEIIFTTTADDIQAVIEVNS